MAQLSMSPDTSKFLSRVAIPIFVLQNLCIHTVVDISCLYFLLIKGAEPHQKQKYKSDIFLIFSSDTEYIFTCLLIIFISFPLYSLFIAISIRLSCNYLQAFFRNISLSNVFSQPVIYYFYLNILSCKNCLLLCFLC